ncbi:hypothetical protein AMTRI_Chr13g122500 [Amborella trichopoda]|uniref:Uncharacterized protein n=1 Tax=Amborella trichopoda TaxID=13333 RepID=U5DCE9_AMBTC|nr:hypothetical protein AMTR_s00046p00216280 [Amborella trichopoda]
MTRPREKKRPRPSRSFFSRSSNPTQSNSKEQDPYAKEAESAMTESTKKGTRENQTQIMIRPRKKKCPYPSCSFFSLSTLSNTSKEQDSYSKEAESSMTESTKKRTIENLSQTISRPRKKKCPRPSHSFFSLSSLSITSKEQDPYSNETASSINESIKKQKRGAVDRGIEIDEMKIRLLQFRVEERRQLINFMIREDPSVFIGTEK